MYSPQSEISLRAPYLIWRQNVFTRKCSPWQAHLLCIRYGAISLLGSSFITALCVCVLHARSHQWTTHTAGRASSEYETLPRFQHIYNSTYCTVTAPLFSIPIPFYFPPFLTCISFVPPPSSSSHTLSNNHATSSSLAPQFLPYLNLSLIFFPCENIISWSKARH